MIRERQDVMESVVPKDDAEPLRSDLLTQLRETQKIAGVGSWLHDIRTGSLVWSEESYRLLGCEPGAIRLTVGLFLRCVYREDRVRVCDAIRNSINQGLSMMLVFRSRWPTGEIHFLRVEGRLVQDRNGVRQWRGTIQDITERKLAELERDRMFDQVCAGRELMQTLSHRLLQAQEAERRAIARDLHDEIGQTLTALRMSLEAASRAEDVLAASVSLTDSLNIVDQMLHHVRDLALDLRPSMLDDLGLVATLKWYLARQANRCGWTADFYSEGIRGRYEEYVEAACFRVAQEALTNAARHAKAHCLFLSLHQKPLGVLELIVKDDGIGFDPPKARSRAKEGLSIGLLGMEERVRFAGGTIMITSRAGEGTTICAQFPPHGTDWIEKRSVAR
jgi:signal transduction histidine kinase